MGRRECTGSDFGCCCVAISSTGRSQEASYTLERSRTTEGDARGRRPKEAAAAAAEEEEPEPASRSTSAAVTS